MTKIALFAATFDPPTLGHLDIIERASKLVDRLIVAVALRLEKKGTRLFTAEERVELLKQLTKSIPNVGIETYNHLTTDFAKEKKALILIRGLRTTSPTHDEFQMALANRSLSGIETLFILGAEQYSHISATLVKEIASAGGSLKNFVPDSVEKAIKKKLV